MIMALSVGCYRVFLIHSHVWSMVTAALISQSGVIVDPVCCQKPGRKLSYYCSALHLWMLFSVTYTICKGLKLDARGSQIKCHVW